MIFHPSNPFSMDNVTSAIFLAFSDKAQMESRTILSANAKLDRQPHSLEQFLGIRVDD